MIFPQSLILLLQVIDICTETVIHLIMMMPSVSERKKKWFWEKKNKTTTTKTQDSGFSLWLMEWV